MMARLASAENLGRARRIDGALERYVEAAKRTLPRQMSFDGLRVVVDCANGAAYKAAPMALEELGAEVISLGIDPDGFNINRDVGSTSPKTLADKVQRNARRSRHRARRRRRSRRAGRREGPYRRRRPADGGRRAATGRTRAGSPGVGSSPPSCPISGSSASSPGTGLTLIRTPVGDRYVGEAMRERGFNVGGEQSGHIILSDFTTTGDGLIAALQVLAVIKRDGRPASEVCHRFDPVPQVMKNFRHKGGRPLENEEVKRAIAEGEGKLNGSGRLVIRASGTEPVIRVMGEGDNAALVEVGREWDRRSSRAGCLTVARSDSRRGTGPRTPPKP